jgi:hypothetical protein
MRNVFWLRVWLLSNFIAVAIQGWGPWLFEWVQYNLFPGRHRWPPCHWRYMWREVRKQRRNWLMLVHEYRDWHRKVTLQQYRSEVDSMFGFNPETQEITP